mmetsp:Transcript_21194/g.45980  ORF Transcript_21194/g.45980 Transcript_21194/m.45980 type:complete len:271 (-) Transcript_21194:664-1476(-)
MRMIPPERLLVHGQRLAVLFELLLHVVELVIKSTHGNQRGCDACMSILIEIRRGPFARRAGGEGNAGRGLLLCREGRFVNVQCKLPFLPSCHLLLGRWALLFCCILITACCTAAAAAAAASTGTALKNRLVLSQKLGILLLVLLRRTPSSIRIDHGAIGINGIGQLIVLFRTTAAAAPIGRGLTSRLPQRRQHGRTVPRFGIDRNAHPSPPMGVGIALLGLARHAGRIRAGHVIDEARAADCTAFLRGNILFIPSVVLLLNLGHCRWIMR